LGAGLPVGFLLLQMIADTGEKFEFLSYFSLYTMFDPAKITSGEDYLLSFIVLAVIGIILYLAGIFVFQKRDLPL
jgi:ABC-2 type transport system permease protein